MAPCDIVRTSCRSSSQRQPHYVSLHPPSEETLGHAERRLETLTRQRCLDQEGCWASGGSCGGPIGVPTAESGCRARLARTMFSLGGLEHGATSSFPTAAARFPGRQQKKNRTKFECRCSFKGHTHRTHHNFPKQKRKPFFLFCSRR